MFRVDVLLIIVFSCLCCHLSSQSSDELKVLAEKLTLKHNTEQDKLKSIFEWVTSNIKYDHKAAKSEITKTKPIAEILKSKSAICTGYSALMKELCKHGGIVCHIVSGYAVNKDEYELSESPDHAWNAVKLDNKWYLLDATWSINNQDEKFYLTEPFTFIKTHLPAHRWWQLLNNPVNVQDFLAGTLSNTDTTKFYHFADTIDHIYKSDKSFIKVRESEEAASYYPTEKNKREHGTVLMEIAGDISEGLTDVMDTTDVVWLHNRFEYILKLCRQASTITELLPTQKELHVEVLLNYTASLYNKNKKKPKRQLKALIEEAKKVLESTPPTYYTRHAKQMIIDYESIIDR